MATEKPVIGSYVGGIKDTIVHEKTGYHVPPKNPRKIAEFLLKILGDEKLKKKLGKNARRSVLATYSSKTLAKKIENLYLSVMS